MTSASIASRDGQTFWRVFHLGRRANEFVETREPDCAEQSEDAGERLQHPLAHDEAAQGSGVGECGGGRERLRVVRRPHDARKPGPRRRTKQADVRPPGMA